MLFNRLLIVVLSLFALLVTSAVSAEVSLSSEALLKNQVIITISDSKTTQQTSGATLLDQLKNAIAASQLNGSSESVDFLFPEFCSLVEKNRTTSLVTHLKLLNDGIAALPSLSESRMQAIKAYLKKSNGEFCNQFVVTVANGDAREFAERITKTEIGNGLVIEELNAVYSYRVRSDEISSLSSSRPSILMGVISSPEINVKFSGYRSATAMELEDGIDNNENGYIDDLFGINSKKFEHEQVEPAPGGFITLAVAKDAGEFIVYTTVEAARAFLYALHRSPDRLIIPYSTDDKVLGRLAIREGLVGIGIDRRVQFVKADPETPGTDAAKAAGKSLKQNANASSAGSSSPRGDLLGAKLIESVDGRVCSYYLDKKNKEQVYLSRLDGKQISGKSVWTVESITSKLIALKAQIATMPPAAGKVNVRQTMKLKKQRDDLILAKRQALNCKKSGYNPKQPSQVTYEHIKPLLEKKCVACHVTRTWADYSQEFFIKTGRVVPGKGSQSSLYMSLRNNPEGFQPGDMPQGMPALSDLNIVLIREWIDGLSSSPEVNPPPPPPLDPNRPLFDGRKLYTDNCSSCHNTLANSTKSGKSFETILASLNPTTGQISMRELGKYLTEAQVKLIALALNTKVASEAENWTVNIGTAPYVASLFRSIFLPDDPATYIAQDTAINTKISQDILAAGKWRFFAGRCDRFETSCLTEAEQGSQKPPPNVIRTGLVNRLIDDLLSSTNPRAVSNALAKIGRTTTSTIDTKAVQDLYNLIYPGKPLPDELASSTASALKGVPGYTQVDYWRFLIKFLLTTGHAEML